jgi:predicted metal-binding protein
VIDAPEGVRFLSDLPTLHICTTCRPAGEADDTPPPGEVLSKAVADLLAAEEDAPCRMNPVVCLASCERACTAVLSQAGKWSYIVGELDPDHAADLIAYARAYGASSAGIVLRSGRPASLHHNIIARVPALAPAFKDAAQ